MGFIGMGIGPTFSSGVPTPEYIFGTLYAETRWSVFVRAQLSPIAGTIYARLRPRTAPTADAQTVLHTGQSVTVSTGQAVIEFGDLQDGNEYAADIVHARGAQTAVNFITTNTITTHDARILLNNAHVLLNTALIMLARYDQ